MPTPRITPKPSTVKTPSKPAGRGKPVAKPRKPVTPKPVGAPTTDGFSAGGRFSVGSAGLSFQGKAGSAALQALAEAIEEGQTPFAGASAAELTRAEKVLETALSAPAAAKERQSEVLTRSSAATCLLTLASSAPGPVREAALGAYCKALGAEKNQGLQMSMMVNLDAAKPKLSPASAAIADKVRAELLPPRPPYEEWFKGPRPTLNVRQYVMDDFFKDHLAAYQERGFTVEKKSPGSVELVKNLVDPAGKNPTVKAHVTLVNSYENVLRDMKDPRVQMIVYAGHAQLGGVVTSSLDQARGEMAGTKLLQFYQCRGKQTVGEVAARFPGVHTTATFSSSYDSDDNTVLTRTFDMIARRGSYTDLKTDLADEGLLQTAGNYMLPNDPRNLASRDEDRDGVRDLTALGADKFYDPGLKNAKGGLTDLKPRPVSGSVDDLAGDKVDHAVSYANTAFFYFAEESRSSPLSQQETDRMVPGGFFASTSDTPAVKIEKSVHDGKTWYQVSVNERYSGQSKEAIAALTLYETQKFLCLDKTGKFTEADQLRGLLLVEGYADMMVPYKEGCDQLMAAFGAHYGFKGAGWDVAAGASKLDGEDNLGSPEALSYLKGHGVVAPG